MTLHRVRMQGESATLGGQDWYRVGRHFGSLLGPEHDIRIVSTGKLYRVGDLTYQRLKKGSEPTPEGWLELGEDGDPIDGDE
jgi:hypothetical protein